MIGRHSIRIPVHGFVELDDWEWEIVNHPVFQRLRRIRQLAFSEHIYPGSTHTRFEHSLGVMHVATKMFDILRAKQSSLMGDRLKFDNVVFERGRALVRLAALLHDVGHAPLSHSGEDLMPIVNGKRMDHEDFSDHLIAESMKDVIDNHRLNHERLRITGREVASFYLGKPDVSANLLVFRDLVSGQLDADRMDYLLRDSHHCGVTYGFYDIDRILDTLVFVRVGENDDAPELKVGIEPGGRHAAEGMILARYFMFEQVYFQKTRMAYDHHGSACLKEALGGASTLPDPTTEDGRAAYLKMDDWYLFEHIRSAKSHDAAAILQHKHDRRVRETSEVASADELLEHDAMLKDLQEKGMDAWSADASKSWYKSGSSEILIAAEASHSEFSRGRPLTILSETAGKIRDSKQRRIYVPLEKIEPAKTRLKEQERGGRHGHA
jgi:HD superfamily phosphohydrolase